MKMEKYLHYILFNILALGLVPFSKCADSLPTVIRAVDPDKERLIDIEGFNNTQYYDHNFDTSAYVFGYEVSPNGQFHHENRGPDGVTYGCYGYLNEAGILKATHYIADGWGYRVVTPGQTVEVFLHPHEHGDQHKHDDTKTNEVHADHHEHHHGRITPWAELFFPDGCGNDHKRNFVPSIPLQPSDTNQISNIGSKTISPKAPVAVVPSNEPKFGNVGTFYRPGQLVVPKAPYFNAESTVINNQGFIVSPPNPQNSIFQSVRNTSIKEERTGQIKPLNQPNGNSAFSEQRGEFQSTVSIVPGQSSGIYPQSGVKISSGQPGIAVASGGLRNVNSQSTAPNIAEVQAYPAPASQQSFSVGKYSSQESQNKPALSLAGLPSTTPSTVSNVETNYQHQGTLYPGFPAGTSILRQQPLASQDTSQKGILYQTTGLPLNRVDYQQSTISNERSKTFSTASFPQSSTDRIFIQNVKQEPTNFGFSTNNEPLTQDGLGQYAFQQSQISFQNPGVNPSFQTTFSTPQPTFDFANLQYTGSVAEVSTTPASDGLSKSNIQNNQFVQYQNVEKQSNLPFEVRQPSIIYPGFSSTISPSKDGLAQFTYQQSEIFNQNPVLSEVNRFPASTLLPQVTPNIQDVKEGVSINGVPTTTVTPVEQETLRQVVNQQIYQKPSVSDVNSLPEPANSLNFQEVVSSYAKAKQPFPAFPYPSIIPDQSSINQEGIRTSASYPFGRFHQFPIFVPSLPVTFEQNKYSQFYDENGILRQSHIIDDNGSRKPVGSTSQIFGNSTAYYQNILPGKQIIAPYPNLFLSPGTAYGHSGLFISSGYPGIPGYQEPPNQIDTYRQSGYTNQFNFGYPNNYYPYGNPSLVPQPFNPFLQTQNRVTGTGTSPTTYPTGFPSVVPLAKEPPPYSSQKPLVTTDSVAFPTTSVPESTTIPPCDDEGLTPGLTDVISPVNETSSSDVISPMNETSSSDDGLRISDGSFPESPEQSTERAVPESPQQSTERAIPESPNTVIEERLEPSSSPSSSTESVRMTTIPFFDVLPTEIPQSVSSEQPLEETEIRVTSIPSDQGSTNVTESVGEIAETTTVISSDENIPTETPFENLFRFGQKSEGGQSSVSSVPESTSLPEVDTSLSDLSIKSSTRLPDSPVFSVLSTSTLGYSTEEKDSPKQANPNIIAVNPSSLFPYFSSSSSNPATCPCYVMKSSENETVATSTPQLQPHPSGGYYLVLFFPYCPGDQMEQQMQNIQPIFPSAIVIPYPCSQCGKQNSSLFAKVTSYGSIPKFDSIQEAFRQNLGNQDAFVPSSTNQQGVPISESGQQGHGEKPTRVRVAKKRIRVSQPDQQ